MRLFLYFVKLQVRNRNPSRSKGEIKVSELAVTALQSQVNGYSQVYGCRRTYHVAGLCTEHHNTVQLRADGPKLFCALRRRNLCSQDERKRNAPNETCKHARMHTIKKSALRASRRYVAAIQTSPRARDLQPTTEPCDIVKRQLSALEGHYHMLRTGAQGGLRRLTLPNPSKSLCLHARMW